MFRERYTSYVTAVYCRIHTDFAIQLKSVLNLKTLVRNNVYLYEVTIGQWLFSSAYKCGGDGDVHSELTTLCLMEHGTI